MPVLTYLHSPFIWLTSNYEKINLTEENGFRSGIQLQRIIFTELDRKQNIMSLVIYRSLNYVNFCLLSKFII